ncbi:hypothetical protein [Streptomyces sp. RP5T]|uniref:hypothetical protein n=1 Tax=Streptomyces sp. RP5T TaxID=2490848 RepID=UPI00163B0992|nr:hypothetical protein [Streptomyces sp. RP5T]
MGDIVEPKGASATTVIAALSPVLAGVLTVIFLLIGYILKLLNPDSAIARTMLTTGWVFGAVAAGATLVAVVALVFSALRNRPSLETGPYGELSEEVARAREAWREALLERGILPFLREALADPNTVSPRRTAPPTPASRMPPLGYDRPGFSSPDDGASGARPSFTSPDYASPDFAGPEHQSE